MTKSIETRLRKLEAVEDEVIDTILIACDQAEADEKLKSYKGSQPADGCAHGCAEGQLVKGTQAGRRVGSRSLR